MDEYPLTAPACEEEYPALTAPKKLFSRLGGGVAIILGVSVALQFLASVIVTLIDPDWLQSSGWLLWVISFAPMYLLAFPVGLLFLRKVPAEPPEKKPFGFGRYLVMIFICFFLTYAGNIIGMIFTAILSLFKNSAVQNGLLTYAMDGNFWLKLLVMVFLAPALEELVFRKMLIDRMRPYGGRVAVVTSALIFALFHGNFSQFFYAFFIGLAFGWVYYRSGRFSLTLGLHMLLNLMGSVVASSVLASVDFDALASGDPAQVFAADGLLGYSLFLLFIGLMFIIGLVFFCLRVKRFRFSDDPSPLPKQKIFSTVWLNVGMIIFFVVSVIVFVINTMA